MENLNNPVEEEKIDAPVETVEAPIVEEVTPEPVQVEEAPAVVEAPEAEEQAVVGTDAFAPSTAEMQAVGSVADGAIGVATTPRPVKKTASSKKKAVQETVAIHSTKNVSWPGVGKVYKGYNIVEKAAADQWLTRSYIRTATPQEIAKEFGK
jgi:hypothetical protein